MSGSNYSVSAWARILKSSAFFDEASQFRLKQKNLFVPRLDRDRLHGSLASKLEPERRPQQRQHRVAVPDVDVDVATAAAVGRDVGDVQQPILCT